MSKITCISPINGQVYAERETCTDQQLAKIIAKAQSAQKIWAQTPISERQEKIRQFLAIMTKNNDDYVVKLAHQMGRPTRFGGELRPLTERTNYMIDLAPKALAPIMPENQVAGIKRYIAKSPVGVVLVIAPWNYPYITANNTITPALLAGNAVILKHSSQTILVGEHFADALAQIGLPDGLFANVVLDHHQTESLLQSGAINHVNFTGSVAGGRAIERAIAGTFGSCGLELGGKDPALVLEDCDFDFAVENLVDGAFYNSGQCCCGIERIYVMSSLYDKFVEKFVALTNGYVLGSPLDANTTLGPMANVRFANTVRAQIDQAVKNGAKPLIDSKKFAADNGKDCYLAPQVLVNVNHKMDVMSEESFGPVVGIMRVHNDQEAIQLMNDSQYGLTASIWSKDQDHAERIGSQVETGLVFMNRCDYVDPGLCWTGVKNTGRGASLGTLGFDSLTRPKPFHLRNI